MGTIFSSITDPHRYINYNKSRYLSYGYALTTDPNNEDKCITKLMIPENSLTYTDEIEWRTMKAKVLCTYCIDNNGIIEERKLAHSEPDYYETGKYVGGVGYFDFFIRNRGVRYCDNARIFEQFFNRDNKIIALSRYMALNIEKPVSSYGDN